MQGDRDYMKGGSDQPPHPPRISLPRTPAAWVVVACVVIHLVLSMNDRDAGMEALGLSLESLRQGRIWTLISHIFVHAGELHLLMNCLAIFLIGKGLSALIGTRRFLAVFFAAGLVGALLHMLFVDVPIAMRGGNELRIMVGASGAVCGLLTALAVLIPQQRILPYLSFILPIRITMMSLALGMMITSGILGLIALAVSLGPQGGGPRFFLWDIAHWGHFGGGLGGFLIMRWFGYRGTMTLDRLQRQRDRLNSAARPLWGKDRRSSDDQGSLTGGTPGNPTSSLPRRRTTFPKNPVAEATIISEEEAEEDFVIASIDPILDKINERGIDSLSEEERATLAQGKAALREQSNRKGEG